MKESRERKTTRKNETELKEGRRAFSFEKRILTREKFQARKREKTLQTQERGSLQKERFRPKGRT